jgi:hypothetical protein
VGKYIVVVKIPKNEIPRNKVLLSSPFWAAPEKNVIKIKKIITVS